MNQPFGGQGRATGRQDAQRLRERYDWLQSFSDDELGMLDFLGEGEVMQPGEDYFDISNPERGILNGMEGETADEGSRYVPRSAVPDHVWEKLTRPFI